MDNKDTAITADESTVQSAEGAATSAPASDAVVDAWFERHFHGLGARLDEFLFNHLRAAKEDLKAILARAH